MIRKLAPLLAVLVMATNIAGAEMYLHADMQMKEVALARTSATESKIRRYRPSDHLLAFLNGLG